ncbi:metallophosphoesterase [Longimicrobium sp.]|uniref:metallophosphoesterase n=1 Tax=Longimicrobium sp. TaxID=2029185 RepID=UPI002E2F23BE|nr:metallophosphoesterase [Longimicrobium sp.]HEX6038496.1 metallophosphoesterase [Longimicrobium sp.]
MPAYWTIVAFLLAWNAVPWMVIGSLFSPVVPGGWRAVLVVALVLFLPVMVIAGNLGGDAYPSATTRLWLYRPAWYTQLFLPLIAIAGVVGLVVGVPFGAAQVSGRWTAGAMGVLLLVLAVWGYAGTRQLVVRPLDVRFAGLPAALEGMRIVQLSDTHVGPHTSRRHLARVADAVRDARPDLVVLTGDQVDDFARDVEPLGRAFGGLSAPLGVYAIAGNHDVYAGWPAVRRGMEGLGWTVLVNEAMPVERNGTRFWIAGTGDPAGGRPGQGPVAPDVERTMTAIPPDAFSLVLAHNPALWPALAQRGANLTLSGHTHYGQLAIPRLGWSVASAFLDLAMGVHRRDDSVLYINPGTNFWGIPFRIGALPEVTVVTLHGSPVVPAHEGAHAGSTSAAP